MKNKKVLGLIIVVLVILGVLVGIFATKDEKIKKETITAENFDNITERIKELNDDDAYYFSYACMQYIFKDGMASIFSDSDSNEAMYAQIYNKKVGELVEEGKQLMKDNNMTVKQYKENLENIGKNQNENAVLTSGSAVENNSVKDKLTTISNDFVTKLWNEIFCNISWYVGEGTNSTGGSLDIEYTMNKADNLMKLRDEYNDYIISLEGEEYSQIKYIWERLIGEIDRMYAKLKEEIPREKDNTYKFDTGNFSEYSSDFKNEINKL